MRCLFFIISSLFGLSASCQAPNSFQSMHFLNHNALIVRADGIYTKTKHDGFRKIAVLNNATASAANANKLWIGSSKGVEIFDAETLKPTAQKFKDTAIASITVDALGKIWVATKFNGVFAQNAQNRFEQRLSVMTNYNATATPDGQVYIGTNVGLYQLSADGMHEPIRYAEEAHSGHGLPDNLVENLYTDQASNLWIIMPDNVSFKKRDNSFGEIPSFAFVGSEDNTISKIVGLKDENYLFVTSNGVLLLPTASLAQHDHADEVFSGEDTNALLLDDKVLGKPAHLESEPVVFAEAHNGRVFFCTKNGLWSVKEKAILKHVRNLNRRSAAKAVTSR